MEVKPLARLSPRVIYAFVAGGLLLSLVLGGIVIWQDVVHSRREFEQMADGYASRVLRRLNSNVAVLNSIRAMTFTLDEPDDEQFALFSREVLRQNSQIRSVRYLVRVKRNDLSTFVADMRKRGYIDFHVKERKGRRWQPVSRHDIYYVTKFVAPFEPVQVQFLGHDMFSDPRFHKSIYAAINSGEAVASPPVMLPNGERGYFLFQAVYAGGERPDKLSERRRSATRLVAIAISIRTLMTGLNDRSGLGTVRLEAMDGTSKPSAIMYDYRAGNVPAASILLPVFHFKRQLLSGGQVFRLSMARQTDFGILRIDVIMIVVFATLLFTGLLYYILRMTLANRAARHKAQAELFRERERAAVTLYSIADAVITTDTDGRVDYMNPVAERMTGWSANDARGAPVDIVFSIVNESSRSRYEIPLHECIRRGKIIKQESNLVILNRNNQQIPVSLSIAPIRDLDGGVSGTVLILQDVSQSREMSRKLLWQASHDGLTGLVNRREFERRLKYAIETAGSEMAARFVLYMDLDRFKVVNDTCGHVAGDAMLKQIAGLLKPLVSGKDTLARLGGDEFGILLICDTYADAEQVAERIIDKVKKYRFSWEDKTFEIGVSIGMVRIISDEISTIDALSHADSACYIAKERGGNRVHVYMSDDDALLKRHGEMQWVHRITRAHEESRFRLHVQQIVPLNRKEDVYHYEILVRMMDENGEEILPTSFIAAAERYNMIIDLDKWIIESAFSHIIDYIACRQANPVLPHLTFSINLSGQSISDPGMMHFIAEMFDRNPGLATCVTFEITETFAVSNMTEAGEFIAFLREKGCRFALDDFGTGVSSFSYLKNLDVDYLKIDGEFVKDVSCDPVDFAMVSSINHMGHVIGVRTVAEYVENEAVYECLKQMGVDYGQGVWMQAVEPLSDMLRSHLDRSRSG